MSTAVFPSLLGLSYGIVRTPVWSTDVQRNVSGITTRIAYWSYPIWQWQLSFEFLRSNAAFGELQTLVGFVNARQGSFDSFLYSDADDYVVIGQAIGVGNGVTTTFQLVRAFGNFVEPMFAPNLSGPNLNGNGPFNVYVGGVLQTYGTAYTVSVWGSAAPGIVTFASPPSGNITVDFTYYFPCCFLTDAVDFTLFMNQLYSTDPSTSNAITFESLKGVA